jgi:hypothetical protein
LTHDDSIPNTGGANNMRSGAGSFTTPQIFPAHEPSLNGPAIKPSKRAW